MAEVVKKETVEEVETVKVDETVEEVETVKVDETVEEVETVKVDETVEEVIERPYTLRKLKDGDLIPLLGLFRKLGLAEFKDVLASVANGGSVQEIGIIIMLNMGDVMIAHLEGEAGEAIYDFYSGLSGIPVDDIKKMEFGTLPLMIYDSFSEVKNTSFFKVLAKLL